jgi:hypothetical protein
MIINIYLSNSVICPFVKSYLMQNMIRQIHLSISKKHLIHYRKQNERRVFTPNARPVRLARDLPGLFQASSRKFAERINLILPFRVSYAFSPRYFKGFVQNLLVFFL